MKWVELVSFSADLFIIHRIYKLLAITRYQSVHMFSFLGTIPTYFHILISLIHLIFIFLLLSLFTDLIKTFTFSSY